MTGSVWPGDWLRGVLEVCVLHTLAQGPSYGYAIAAQLERAGLGTIKGGTLYPLLTRFEKAGLVGTSWSTGESGPARKYYALTDAGRAERDMLASRWAEFARTVEGHLEGGSRPGTEGETS
ncbi:PadR family transcriptional regulator [Georgenia sp. SUBG003]|uniref:PadR family transcriptional regulator n=1 Tax=Georgenia sp. SUBG003 TaxID=1497974 RepID=UPI0004D7AA9E|nr:PadR family transcriptional regulator [Georgenia sp. SUBG003]